MTHYICDECETVNHCRKHGCIPKQPYAKTAAYIESATNGRVRVDPVTGDVSLGKKQPAPKFTNKMSIDVPEQPLYSLDGDVRELNKWLNEEPNRPLNRPALARVLAYLQGYHK